MHSGPLHRQQQIAVMPRLDTCVHRSGVTGEEQVMNPPVEAEVYLVANHSLR